MPQLPRILIVDDTTENRNVLRDAIEPHGFEIFFATNGKTAVTTLTKVIPDLILMDILMPEMDGLQACREIKANP
ncbi:MAG: response regulator, partial [Verrucomicrobiota bacterium]